MELEIKGWGGGVPRKEAGMGVAGALSKGDTKPENTSRTTRKAGGDSGALRALGADQPFSALFGRLSWREGPEGAEVILSSLQPPSVAVSPATCLILITDYPLWSNYSGLLLAQFGISSAAS